MLTPAGPERPWQEGRVGPGPHAGPPAAAGHRQPFLLPRSPGSGPFLQAHGAGVWEPGNLLGFVSLGHPSLLCFLARRQRRRYLMLRVPAAFVVAHLPLNRYKLLALVTLQLPLLIKPVQLIIIFSLEGVGVTARRQAEAAPAGDQDPVL